MTESPAATLEQPNEVSPRDKFKAQYKHRDTLKGRFNALKQTIHKVTGKKPTSQPDILDKANSLILYASLRVCEPRSLRRLPLNRALQAQCGTSGIGSSINKPRREEVIVD
jgi:hypothetical protein